MTTPRLQIKGLTKRYPSVVANDDVSLSVQPGEIHAVLGENGAAGVVTVSAPDSPVTTITKWFNLLTTNERVKQGLGDSKASSLTACASCALDGNALKVRVAFPKSRRLFTAPCRVHYS